MPVYAIIKLDVLTSQILQEKFNLEDFSIFTKGTIRNVIRAMARDMVQKAKGGNGKMLEIREKLNDQTEIKILTTVREQHRVIVITDGEYSPVVGERLLREASTGTQANYDKLIKEYKNWKEKDVMTRIEEELEKCNMVVVEGLSQVLERGESLSELVDRSENLNSQTKLLFKTAKKKNRCC